MFQIRIADIPVIMTKFFANTDRDSVLAAIPERTNRVVFIDTPATPRLVAAIKALLSKGIEVVVRDHHDVPNPDKDKPREQQIHDAAQQIRKLVGSNAVISDRTTHPACSTLIRMGEFNSEGTVIVADPDLDGLTAAMKATGVYYSQLDADAAVLDSGRANQTSDNLSPDAYLLVRAMAALPPYDPQNPGASSEAKAVLFSSFVSMVQAKTHLESMAAAYETKVGEAQRLADTAIMLLPGVTYVDVTQSAGFHLATLLQSMEGMAGCKITVQKRAWGAIARLHGGVQYSLMVVQACQQEVNLQDLLPGGFISSPEAGVIVNTTFLLYVSEEVWNNTVLPALHVRFPAE